MSTQKRWALCMVLLILSAATQLTLATDKTGPLLSRQSLPAPVEAAPYPSFALALNTSSITFGRGEDAVVQLTVRGFNGFNQTIGFSANIMPDPPLTGAFGIDAGWSQTSASLGPDQESVSVTIVVMAWSSLPPGYPSLGSYTMNFFGTAQTQSHEVKTAQLQLNITPHAIPDPRLLFELSYLGELYPGGTIELKSDFANVGNVPDKINALNFTGDFGNTAVSNGVPVSLYPGQKTTVTVVLRIASNIIPGKHDITGTAEWTYRIPDYLDLPSNNYYPGSQGFGNPIHITGQITIVSNNSPVTTSSTSSSNQGLARFLQLRSVIGSPTFILGLMIYALFAGVAVLLVVHDHRKKNPLG